MNSDENAGQHDALSEGAPFAPDPNSKPIDILLVEDTEADIKITLRAFKKARLRNNIYVCHNGQEALDFLYHQGDYKDAAQYPRPDLVLLDINMPKLNGYEVLQKLKADPAYCMIPVIMLTSSKSEEDIVKSYQKGATSYIQKPVEYEAFVRIVEGFNFYWNIVNKLPDQKS